MGTGNGEPCWGHGCWGGRDQSCRGGGGEFLCQEEKLPWGQQRHQHQGNHGFQVHPAGRKEEISEFNHHPRDRASTGGREGEARGTYTLARRSGQASRSRFATGSSFSFFPSRARGTLNTSRALEWAEREWSW